MSTIAIKDLPESVDLDRKAMLAVVGGARFGGGRSLALGSASPTARIIDYPPGLAAYVAPGAGVLPAGSKPGK